MTPPVRPPVAPMLARLSRELPGEGWLYEPKWDGFRCLAFRDGDDIDLRSRHDRPLARYFPELVEALRRVPAGRFVLDAEIVSAAADFSALMARLHPARSRVERLSREAPALLVAFDLLALGDDDLRPAPFAERRRRLVAALCGARPPLFVTPLTDEPAVAEAWLDGVRGGLDGVMAKRPELVYEPGRRAMVKVKPERTADCVVAGFRWAAERPVPSSLLLGLHDGDGVLRHVGVVTSFTARERERLLETLTPLAGTIEGHPWERGFLVAGSPIGRLKGAAGRWSPDEMALDWVPLDPRLVCEVAYDQLDRDRFRHPARFRRWRPDREAASCLLDQLENAPLDVEGLLA